MTEDKMVGQHHQLDGHEFEHVLGGAEGQGSLVCCSLWSHKELDMTEREHILKVEIHKSCLCSEAILLFSGSAVSNSL